jgi:hypothetical protein
VNKKIDFFLKTVLIGSLYPNKVSLQKKLYFLKSLNWVKWSLDVVSLFAFSTIIREAKPASM